MIFKVIEKIDIPHQQTIFSLHPLSTPSPKSAIVGVIDIDLLSIINQPCHLFPLLVYQRKTNRHPDSLTELNMITEMLEGDLNREYQKIRDDEVWYPALWYDVLEYIGQYINYEVIIDSINKIQTPEY